MTGSVARTILMQRKDPLYSIEQHSQNIPSFKCNENNKLLSDNLYYLQVCFITALALSLGGLFWFDLLKKKMQIRGSISKPATSQVNEDTILPEFSRRKK